MPSPFPTSESLRADASKPVDLIDGRAGKLTSPPAPAPSSSEAGPRSRQRAAWESPEFGAMYEEYSRPIYYLALRFLSDPTQAEDATHDVFLKAYRKLGEFRGEAALRTWLYRIAINHCRNLLQSWHRRTMITNVDDAVWEQSASRSESPLRALETAELGERIRKTLERLPDEYRLLLLLVADQELSYDAVGELTEQTADAVRG